MRIAVFGRTKMLYDAAVKLSDAGHKIVIIGTCKEAPEYTVTTKDFRELAVSLGSAFFVSPTLNSPQIIEMLKNASVDIGISANWLSVVGSSAIKSCGIGILNAHCGDLPRYRGNACPNWAIINGEDKIGLSIHFMEPEKLDSGDIVVKKFLPISDSTNIGDVYKWLEVEVPNMFLESVSGIENNTIIPTPQDKVPANALRCYPRIPKDSRIDWAKNSASIDRLIRASSEPFAGAYSYLNSEKVIIWRGKVGDLPCPSCFVPGQILWKCGDSGDIAVGTGGNGVLIITRAQVEGEQEIKPSAMAKSLRWRFE